MPSVTVGADVVNFILTAAPTYPYPVVLWSSRAANETLAHFVLRQGVCIIDFQNSAAQFSDFAQAAWATGGWGLLGNQVAGLINADLSMVAMSSTKAAVVNGLAKYQSNSFQLARLGLGSSSVPAIGCYFTGKLTGTPQGHQYNGMQSYETNGSVFGPFTIKSVVSVAGGVPPYETMAWTSFHDTNATWTDFEIDGRDATGVAVTAAGIGLASTDKAGTILYQRGYIHDLTGGGITHYNITNTTLNFVDMRWNNTGGAAINLERCGGSTVTVTRPVFGNSPEDIIADSDQGFVTINIVDPVLSTTHPKVIIRCHKVYDYPGPDVDANKQINPATNNYTTLTVGGVSRPDLIQWIIG